MTIKDSIKKIFHPGQHEEAGTGVHSTSAHHTASQVDAPSQGQGTVTQERTVRAPDPHVPAGTAAGHTVEAQRHHASTMPQPEMESEVWPEVHGKYHEASKEARLTNQNARLAEEELEKLHLAQSQAQDATSRQAQLKQEAAGAQQQFGQFDNMKGDAARAQEAIRLREQQAAQLAQEAEAAKRAAMEKQRAAQGLGPQGQQAERELQATAAEIEANKRRAGELQTRQQELEQLEQQRLAAERDTGRFAQALAQEKAKVQQLEEQLAAAKQRINEGNNQLHHLQSVEAELSNKIRHMGGKESPMQALRELEGHHQQLVQRATAAQAALEEERRLQQARLQEARAAEQRYKEMLGRLNPANAEVQRAKQEAERLAVAQRDNEARAHDLAQRHQGILSEVERHTHTLQAARTDAERHMQLFHKYEGEAEAAHNRKQEHWGAANQLVNQMNESETGKFGTMQNKIKEFGNTLFHHQQTTGAPGQTVTTEEHRSTMGGPGQTTSYHSSTAQGPNTGTMGAQTSAQTGAQPSGGIVGQVKQYIPGTTEHQMSQGTSQTSGAGYPTQASTGTRTGAGTGTGAGAQPSGGVLGQVKQYIPGTTEHQMKQEE